MAFSLVKWYLDCITSQGDTAILYCADLRWRGIHLRYSSGLFALDGAITTQSSVARYELDAASPVLRVAFPTLGISGCWTSRASPVRAALYKDAVDWNCLQPASSVTVRIGDRELNGLGYAECLTLTEPPWQLPLQELRWGRFVTPEDSLAWIDWRGPHSTRVAVHNGRATESFAVSETEVALDDATLHLDEGLVLRSGTLGATVFPGMGVIAKLLPSSLRNVDERKWRSQATLVTEGRESHGWAIHEVVLWNC